MVVVVAARASVIVLDVAPE
jgi:hypothetical protein